MAQEKAPLVIVGAGLVGLTLAIDLLLKGVSVVVLEKGHGVAEGSRSICQAKRSLEIWDRLGVGEAIRDRGVTWKVGRVFWRERELFNFDLLPEPGHKMPAFVNLQQNLLEELLHRRFAELGGAVRFGHALAGLAARDDGVTATVEGPDGRYEIEADWLVSCEGVRSVARRALGLTFEGEVFKDKFLICDIRMKNGGFPSERRFWFEPPFHEGQTALLHKQADDVWRIDLQVGWAAEAVVETRPENARARIRKMLGHDDFEFVWISLYVFQCRTLSSYVHGRVIFAGDSAHQVSPFGARGGNGGVQDADNLAWKLARILEGRAPAALLESYDLERLAAARENILHSTRATDFMTPKSKLSRRVRDETLALAADAPFARSLINSGRLSRPAHLRDSPLNTADDADWATGEMGPGSPALDAPIRADGRDGFLIERLGRRFVLLAAQGDQPTPRTLLVSDEPVDVLALGRDIDDRLELVAQRYDLKPGSVVLFRPDQHVCMRGRTLDVRRLESAVARAVASSMETAS
jgi:3-(3-hydroxy-phenyl)propionate hydroxylase